MLRRTLPNVTESVPGQPPAGWYPRRDDPTEFRYWDGLQWAPDADDATRRSALAVALGHQTAMGGVVADRGDYWAVVTVYWPGDNVQHGLHLVLCLVTCFAWLPFWILIALTAKGPRHETYRFTVDHQARVRLAKLK